jgi:lysophospholipase L1-like esterase
VVFAGDSFVFGDGVDADSSFTAIVSRVAASNENPCVRILNLGERGTTITRQARRLREVFNRLRPDVVVVFQYQNDLTDLLRPEPLSLALDSEEHGQGTTIPQESSAEGAAHFAGLDAFGLRPEGIDGGAVSGRLRLVSSSTLRFLSYHLTARLIEADIHRDALAGWSVLADSSRRAESRRLTDRYTVGFDSLAHELRTMGVDLGVVILPSKLDLLAGRFPEESFFLDLAARHGLPALSLYPVLEERRSPYTFLMYDGHLNEHGNRLVAEQVLQWLFHASPAPFPALRGAPDSSR